MHVGVELVTLGAGIESLESVLLKCVHEDRLGHLETRVKVRKVLVATVQLLLGHDRKGAVEVVNAVEQISREALEGKVLGCANLTLGLLLQVAVFGDLALPLVLQLIVSALLFYCSIVSLCANEP